MASSIEATYHENVDTEKDLETRCDYELGSDDMDLPLCDPCQVEGSRISAAGYCKTCGEYLCQQCYGYHCKPKPSRHHVLVDSQNMPKSKSHLPAELTEDCHEKCLIHDTELLKIYCRTHDVFGCIVCLSCDHKTCDVSFIHECAKGISDSKEYLNFQKDLHTLEKDFNAQLEAAISKGDTIKDMLSKTNTTDAIEEMTVLLEECRNIDTTKTTTGNMVDHVTKTCIGTISKLQTLMSDKTSDAMKFINMKRGKLTICEVGACLKTLKTQSKLSNEAIEKLLSDIRSLQVRINKCVVHKCFGVPQTITQDSANAKEAIDREKTEYSNINAVSKLPYYIRATDENVDCRITGSATLTDGHIILVDFNNKSLKIHSPEWATIKQIHTFQSSPFDAAVVHQEKLVVTVPSQKEIYIFSLNETELTYETTLTTSGSCYGICSGQGVLFVAFGNPPKVEMLNMNGTTLKSFVMDFTGEKLFSSPWYVAYSPVNSRLYVTDRENDTVTCLTVEGKVGKIYKDSNLVRPYGVAIDSSGTVYVCSRRMNMIHCLSPDLELISTIEDDVYFLKAESVVCWNKSDRLYVGLYQDDELAVLDIVKS